MRLSISWERLYNLEGSDALDGTPGGSRELGGGGVCEPRWAEQRDSEAPLRRSPRGKVRKKGVACGEGTLEQHPLGRHCALPLSRDSSLEDLGEAGGRGRGGDS